MTRPSRRLWGVLLALLTGLLTLCAQPQLAGVAPVAAVSGVHRQADTIQLNPAAQQVVVGQTATVTAVVTAAGSPQTGVSVSFQVTGGPNSGRTGTATTDANGNAVFMYSGTVAGTDRVQATVGTDTSNPASIEWDTTQVGLNPGTQSLVVGSTATVKATVGLQGNPVSGVTVTFSLAGPNGPASMQATTDATGSATFTYTGAVPGTDTVQASITDPVGHTQTSNPATVQWSTLVVTLAPGDQSVTLGGTASVKATVTLNGNFQSNVPVSFTATGVSGTVTGSGVTDVNGGATFAYSDTGTTAGHDSVQASVQDPANRTQTSNPVGVEWTAPAPEPVVFLAPITQSVEVGGTATVDATVTLNGAPVVNGSITFLVNGSPFGPSTTTDANGHATFTYTSNTVGPDAVTATVPGSSNNLVTSNRVTVRWTAVPVVALVPASQSHVVGQSAGLTATVTVSGAAVPNTTVTFLVTSGPNAGVTASVATDASGNAPFSYTGTGAGTDAVQAAVVDPVNHTDYSNVVQVVWAADQGITATGTTLNERRHRPFTAGVATFTDPDVGATAAEYTATIDWGDGTTGTGTVTGGTGGPFTVTGTHTYRSRRTFTVTVTITDRDNGANTARATTTIHVR
ncbi:Ig-like domain-containing protein [Kitasatospora sp. NPDC059722]|uniref:Ig-like domain-containing protein n=1 Tax=Kitasatospora sp. NPDC059722 TaxID=3346925 RepID=UPI0036A0C780